MATLKINRGTTFVIGVSYMKDGVPATLVGSTVRFTMKSSEFTDVWADTDAAVQFDQTDGTVDGSVTFKLDPEDTAELEPGKYYYDIKVQEPGGDIYKLDEGTVKLDGSPTNRRT